MAVEQQGQSDNMTSTLVWVGAALAIVGIAAYLAM
jgi:hypothetical protein